MSALRKIKRVGKRASKFQYTATYQSVVVECLRDKWRPSEICIAWSRKGRRLITKKRPWIPSPNNKMRGVVVWPDPEIMEVTVTLYKGPKDKSYETKEWEFAVIDVDSSGKRKVLATTSINMVRYVSSMPYEHDVHLRLKPVSRKIKSVLLHVSLCSEFLKEGKATDDDMMSIASMMSLSNLSTIGFLEDDEDEEITWGGRSITPPSVPESVFSTDGLLKWAQEVTKEYQGVKITNMTTSWRNGLGFLAIIHYHRPDLLDFEEIPPNSIKENNRLAIELARHLGIACSLTPNMMLTSTVPDKLAVTSFVYQIYMYFTRATVSAIVKNESGHGIKSQNTPSPFDMTSFDQFTFDKLSPVASPGVQGGRSVNVYSRFHQKDGSSSEVVASELPLSPVQSSSAGSANDSSTTVDSDGTCKESGSPVGRADPIAPSSTPKPSTEDSRHVREIRPSEDGTAGESKLSAGDSLAPGKQDTAARPVHAQSSLIRKTSQEQLVSGGAASGHTQQAPASPEARSMPSREGDRTLELENLCESDSEPTTVSTCSLDSSSDLEGRKGEEGGRGVQEERKGNSPTTSERNVRSAEQASPEHDAEGGSKSHRKLPTIPSDKGLSQKSLDMAKREEFRRKAREMLKKAQVKSPSSSSLKDVPAARAPSSQDTPAQDSKQEGYKEKARQMLSEAFGTPKTERRSDAPNERTREETNTVARPSPVSSSSDKTADEEESPIAPAKPNRDGGRSKPPPLSNARKTKSVDSELVETRADDTSRQEERRRGTVGSVERRRLPDTAGRSPKAESPRHASVGRSNAASRQRKQRPTKTLPMAKPVTSTPSSRIKQLTELKKQRSAEADGPSEGGAGGQMSNGLEQKPAENGESERRDPPSPVRRIVITPMEDESARWRSPGLPQTLESPSAWSQHSEDLSKDLLVTQSEYVRAELLSLQGNLQGLEVRASNIEADIRNAMSVGDKEEEESLMQEWFEILNKKNELIKRQIELNLLEKEEDLEKRQFFLNRELRPLMEISEEQKTPEQKDREAKLLKDLLELIDERDKLERIKMSTQLEANSERQGFAAAQAKTGRLVRNETRDRSGSKDCVIQ